jgi:signal transduction histidine kinase
LTITDSTPKPDAGLDTPRRDGAAASPDGLATLGLSDVNREVSDLRRALTRKSVELEMATRELNHLLGMIAHDLRNPLGVILGFAELLNVELAASINSEQRGFIEQIGRSAESMLRSIDELLDFSRIESGRLDLEPKVADLAELARQNLVANGVIAGRKNIVLRCRVAGAERRISIDVRRIEQVLNNLIGNAIKFSYPGGEVNVTLAFGSDAVAIEVADRGIGIPKEQLERLFTPLAVRGRRGTADEPSTGLGLAICRRIVEAHRGTIRVESEEGAGAKFIVTIPAV